jgi:beta-lactamase regulating signal transducer with metallopeptidase domain
MIAPAVILYSIAAAALVWAAGRKDAARDPRLTFLILFLLAAFPLLSLLPKVEIAGLPAATMATSTWVVSIWAAGALLFSVRLVIALIQLTRWRMLSVAVSDAEYTAHKPEIRMLDCLTGPVAAGVFRPLILVPPTWPDWSPTLKRTVVAHETAHHRRHDPLWRSIAAITCTLHWYNPLVWWMSARLADQCEYACDEQVVRSGISVRSYASDLCDAANVCRAPATTLAMASRGGLESRVQRMLAPPPSCSVRSVVCLASLALTGAVALAMVERKPAVWIPAIDVEEVRTRLHANPFPADDAP